MNRLKKNTIVLLLILFEFLFFQNAFSQGVNRSFSIDLNKSIGKVNPLFWGTNFLFWIEDDEALVDKKIENSLINMPCTILRYPGGTVADNFHWKTNLLDNKFRFPNEEGQTESDFDEFMAFCKRVNAEPILVVNTESWWIHRDIDNGVKEAADWVKYCLEKRYNVKYWEIGNETYWHPFMTAREYGQVVKKYAQAMKLVDPTIMIAANGHWDVEMTGTKERTLTSELETIRQKYLNISSESESDATDIYADQFKNTDIRSGTEKWWKNVAEECGAEIDMISIHWYYMGSTSMNTMTNSLNLVRDVFKTIYPDREYKMCMTEYNCNSDDHIQAVSGLFDGIGRFLMAGVEIANFWPLRNGIAGNRRSMLGFNTKEEGYAYQILQLLGNNLKGEILEVNSENQIFPFVTYNGDQLTILISGRGITKEFVNTTLSFPEIGDFTLTDAKSFNAQELNTVPIRLIEKDILVTNSATGCTFKIMPFETIMLRFKRNKNTLIPLVSFRNKTKISSKKLNIDIVSSNKIKLSVYNIQGQKVAQKYVLGNSRVAVPTIGIYLMKVESTEFECEFSKIQVNK